MKDNNPLDLVSLLHIFARRKGVIVGFTLLVAVIAVMYSLITPEIWRSEAAFYTIDDKGTSLPFGIPNLGGLASSFLSMDNNQGAIGSRIILESRTLSEEAIREFNLIKYYKINEQDTLKAMDMALKKLRRNTVYIDLNDNTGLLVLGIETKDRHLSRDIAKFYLQRLEYYNQFNKLTKGKLYREFLEGRVLEVRAVIDTLINEVQTFQENYKALNLDAQMRSIIEMYSSLVADKMKAEMEYDLAREIYSAQSPILLELERRKEYLNQLIRDLERKSGGNVKPAYLIDIDKIPDIAARYAQLNINLEIQRKVFEFIYPQYEAAILEERRDMPTIEIVDQPRVPGLRVRPRRAVICLVATFIGFIMSLCLAFIKDSIAKQKERWRSLTHAFLHRQRGEIPPEADG